MKNNVQLHRNAACVMAVEILLWGTNKRLERTARLHAKTLCNFQISKSNFQEREIPKLVQEQKVRTLCVLEVMRKPPNYVPMC